MDIYHFSTFSFEGGAAKAAARLHLALLKDGVRSNLYCLRITGKYSNLFLVKFYFGIKFFIKLRPYIDSLLLKFFLGKSDTPWTIGWLPSRINNLISTRSNYVLHFHWIGAGFISLKSLLTFKKRIVFTLHDSWLYTAGCHLTFDCENFKTKCSLCPQLGGNSQFLVEYLFEKKRKYLLELRPVVICPSRWIFEQAKSSYLLSDCDLRIIPNSIDCTTFSPIQVLRKKRSKFRVGFSALHALKDKNKGFHYFKEVITHIANQIDILEVHIIGASEIDGERMNLDFPCVFHGTLDNDSALANFYSSNDILCVPSITESFCQVAAESIACGTPVVCFDTSGLRDIVKNNISGYLAESFKSDDLSTKIVQYYNLSLDEKEALSISARKFALENFDQNVISLKMKNLYNEINEESKLL